jgi:uncharacterized protein (DUF362 family)
MDDRTARISEHTVSVHYTGDAFYPREPPFHPDEAYPEYQFPETASERNPAYEAVRSALSHAGHDEERAGTPEWSPLSDVLEPDDTVLVKPNLVKEDHPRDPDGWRYVLTHGSVIRAVCDYLFQALGPNGRVVVADAPHTDSSFAAISDRLGLAAIRDFYVERGYDCAVVDLRQSEWHAEDGVVLDRYDLDGDPYGYTEFDLGDASEFADHGGKGDYYGADYDTEQVNTHHTGGRHEYLIATSPIEADVVFNLPKAKTHKKAGVTLGLKNLVGINGDKNYLPHHTKGSSDGAGDEHPAPDTMHRIERSLVSLAQDVALAFPRLGPRLYRAFRPVGEAVFGSTDETIRSGNWWGNDTVWRMCLDLNKLLLYGDTAGTLSGGNRKRHYSLCDGIIAGEGRGPMDPDPVQAGFISFGTNPVAVDLVTTWLMGFDPEAIPIIANAFECSRYSLTDFQPEDVMVESNHADWNRAFTEIPVASTLDFEPHFGWKSHIENGTKPTEAAAKATDD